MTKREYAQVRDGYTRALNALRDTESDLVCLAGDMGEIEDGSVGSIMAALNEGGAYIEGEHYYAIIKAIESLEIMVGRAHSRSVD